MGENIIDRSTGNNLGTKQNLQSSQKVWQNQKKDGQKFESSRKCCLSDENSENALMKILKVELGRAKV